MASTPLPLSRVFVADGSAAFRSGLGHALACSTSLSVVGESDTSAGALLSGLPLRPDVILVEACLPGLGGIEVARRFVLEVPGCIPVVIAAIDWDAYLAGAWAAGARGFLSRNLSTAALVGALDQARLGMLFSAEQKARIRTWQRTVASPLDTLGEREWAVFGLLVLGMGNREMAERLVLSENTVEKHVASLLHKLSLHSRSSAAAFAFERHLHVLGRPDKWTAEAAQQWWQPVQLSDKRGQSSSGRCLAE